ncbi:MAG: VWA domain-containing protein [Myxococcaceae bacterium]|nr:VWA domain-containing protein [Myxococcaceae bacterium]
MNRTSAFIALAAALLLVAVVVGLPKSTGAPPTPAPAPTPTPTATPAPPPLAGNHPGSLSLSGKLSHPYVVPGTSDVFATLEVSAVDVPGARRAPVNLAVVIDRSGSMSGDKIAQARRAALRLVDLLDEHDRLAIIHYGSDVRFFPGAFASTENKERMRRYIRGIADEGGTNIGDGLMAGKAQLDVARSDFTVNRLILLSDGQPTVGITSENGLANVARTLRNAGTTVTSLGVGADFNEDLMQRLAEIGGGSYGFIRDAEATAALFEKDLSQAGTMVARGVTVSFDLPPGIALREVFGRPSSRLGNRVTVSMPDFSARQTEKLVVHLAASNLSGAEGMAVDVGDFRLDYTDLLTSQAADAQVKLAAMLTADRSLADQRRDKDAIVFATRARASQNVEKAAVAMQKGKFEEARQFIRENTFLFDDAQTVAGAEAFEGDRAANAQQADVVRAAPAAAPAVQSERVKSMKVEAKRGYGLGSSVY